MFCLNGDITFLKLQNYDSSKMPGLPKSNLAVCSHAPCCDAEPLLCAGCSVTVIGVVSRGLCAILRAAGAVGGREAERLSYLGGFH